MAQVPGRSRAQRTLPAVLVCWQLVWQVVDVDGTEADPITGYGTSATASRVAASTARRAQVNRRPPAALRQRRPRMMARARARRRIRATDLRATTPPSVPAPGPPATMRSPDCVLARLPQSGVIDPAHHGRGKRCS